MTDSNNDPSGTGLLLLGFVFLAGVLLLSLSNTEKAIVALAFLAFRLSRRYDVTESVAERVFAFITPTQKFSEQADQIYKSRLQGRKIRLLRLLPGDKEAKIQCRLVEASLDTVPSYEAISYVWGRPQKREPIECDGHDAHIIVNLAQVLRRLRSKTVPRTLWVDGICINQDNVLERGHQVGIMGVIYKEASRVVIWLGPDEDGTISKAMKVVRYVNAKIPGPGHGAPVSQNPNDPTIENLERLVERDEGVKNAWNVLGKLFERKWWQRIWCAQEAILAKRTIVICGDEEIDGELIGAFTRWQHGQRWAGQPNPPNFQDNGVRSAYRRLNKWAWSGTFLETLDTFRGLEATDPRDKVYALIGLLQINRQGNIWNPILSINYEKSVPEVLFDSILCSVRSEGNLHFLSYIDDRPDLEDRGKYPSWMPRWNEIREPWPDQLWCSSSRLSAGIRSSLADSVWKYSDALTLTGAKLDTITSTTDVCWLMDNDIGDTLYAWILNHLRWVTAQSKNDLTRYQSFMTRLAITLTGGYLKTDGWVENRMYFEHIEDAIGTQYLADFYGFLHENFQQDVRIRKPPSLKNVAGYPQSYHALVKTYCGGRQLFHTSKGYIGLGPRSLRHDDEVVVLDGGKIPFVLRPQKIGGYAFIGECFVYDVMANLTLDVLYDHGYQEEEILLR